MALIVSDKNNASYDGYFSTANGFYRAEAYNFGGTYTSATSLATPRTIPVTFANAGNCQGLIIAFYTVYHAPASSYGPVTVALQELVGATWTERVSKTLTSQQIHAGKTTTMLLGACPIRAFRFDTPYAVDTTAGKWRFIVSQVAGSYSNNIYTSNNSADVYVTWCDNKVSYTPDDSLVALDEIKIDQDVTLGAMFSTGQTTSPTCAWICAGDDPNPLNEVKLSWDDKSSGLPAGAWTLTCKGMIALSGYATFEIGTTAKPIPIATKATLTFPQLASGSYSGIRPISFGHNADIGINANIIWVGENKMIEGKIATEVAVNATDIVLQTNVGFAVNDKIMVGGAITTSSGPAKSTWYKEYTITAITPDGLTLSLDAPILSYKRAVGAPVVKVANTSGIEYNAYTKGTPYNIVLYSSNNIQIEGVRFFRPGLSFYRYPIRTQDAVADTLSTYIKKCLFYEDTNADSSGITNGMNMNENGATVSDNQFVGCTAINSSFTRTRAQSAMSGKFIFNNNLLLYSASYYGVLSYSNEATITNNRFYNLYNTRATGRGCVLLRGAGVTVSNNYFFGLAIAFNMQNFIDPIMKDNTFEQYGEWTGTTAPGGAYWFESGFSRGVSVNDIFIDPQTNSYTHGMYSDCNADWCFNNPTGTMKFIDFRAFRDYWVAGSRLGVQDNNALANDCQNDSVYGSIITTGDGLTDTTVRTSGTGKYAIRMESITSLYEFAYPLLPAQRSVPTGNILGKTMMVGVWCKISNANYYSGTTYQMPRVYVKYDNLTTVYGEAAKLTDWQFIFVPFTPTTSFGQIEVWISTLTDQTTTNAYVYFDDISVLYPAGHTINLGGMDLTAGGFPVWPPISTLASAQDVWAVDPASFGASTVGDKINKTKNDTGLIPALL